MLQLSLQPYRRQFLRPLHTAHGPWRERRGLILRLQADSGQSSYGEIAPIPWFGTETLEEAIAWLTPLQGRSIQIEDVSTALETSPSHYSATRFGLGMAITQLQGQFPTPAPEPPPEQICALLPAGAAALEAWPALWNQGHRTFKWKLGLGEIAPELALLEELRRSLPPQAKLRLDANGGLSLDAAKQCLQRCDDLQRRSLPIEFLEQPLPPEQFHPLMALSQTNTTALALDESVTGLSQLKRCYDQGWRGIFVVKGAIAGHPLAVIDFCRRHRLNVVFSSVFETGLARQAVLAMAQAVYQPHPNASESPGSDTMHSEDRGLAPNSPRMAPQALPPASQQYAFGFGVRQWLSADGLETQPQANDLNSNDLNPRGEALWKQLSNC